MTVTSACSMHIVVGFDLAPLSELALREAASLASRTPGSAIHVATIIDGLDGTLPQEAAFAELRKKIAACLGRSASQPDTHIFSHLLSGDPAAELISLAEDVEADLIVVGTHGRRGMKRLLMGSVAGKVVREATCPVLVVRPRRHDARANLMPEPPCSDCLAVRSGTGGRSWWCTPHQKPWTPPHRYTYSDGTLHPFHPDGIGPT